MNIGIIVHSYTGNTLLIANKIKEIFMSRGHSVCIERVVAVDEDPSMSANVELKISPLLEGYDLLIFGAPVRAFALSPVMKKYLEQIDSLKGRKVGYFVTQFFPFARMGGKQSILQFKKICESKGATIYNDGIVNWSNSKRDTIIYDVVKKMTHID